MAQGFPLPEPTKVRATAPVSFSVEAAIVHRLGRESVSDKVLAVLELVKNSYDADATKVVLTLRNLRTGNPEITVSDDGSGMGVPEIVDGWMRVATPVKAAAQVTPIYQRRTLGEKGIGRFAVENLSSETILTSFPRDLDKGYRITFNWDMYSLEKDLQSVQNPMGEFDKPPGLHGLEIRLRRLRHRWTESDVQRLRMFLRSLAPPGEGVDDFQVVVDTDEFQDLSGTVDSDFLGKALFTFESELAKSGRIEYVLQVHGKATPMTKKTAKWDEFGCGPVKFRLHFYYRTKGKMTAHGIQVDDISILKSTLDSYGGVKVYRDGVRLSGFGNPDDDWTGLDAMSRNDPSVVPARNQIIASVQISGELNPEITDTTTRENLIKNPSFQDMLRFVQDSIATFAQMRGEYEQKRKPAPKAGNAYVKQARQNIQSNRTRKELLEFTTEYPMIFYDKLEEEINLCYVSSLPNATLVLSRKLVENLLYQLMEDRFPKDVALRYNVDQGRANDFSVLIRNLEARAAEFDREQRELIDKMLALVKPFRRDANSTAHKVMEYLDTIDDLDKLKIPEIVELELQLMMKVKKRRG